MEVNDHFTLILNSLKSGNHPANVISSLIETYRGKALDVFIRGLGADTSRLLVIRSAKDLPEAYSICLELQRLGHAAQRNAVSKFLPYTPAYHPMSSQRFPSSFQMSNRPPMGTAYNQGFNRGSPHRLQGPRPAIKAESKQSGQSYRSNFNPSPEAGVPVKRSPSASSNLNPFRKAQRLYHMEPVLHSSSSDPQEQTDEAYYRKLNHEILDVENDISPQRANPDTSVEAAGCSDGRETNFMTDVSLVYHTLNMVRKMGLGYNFL